MTGRNRPPKPPDLLFPSRYSLLEVALGAPMLLANMQIYVLRGSPLWMLAAIGLCTMIFITHRFRFLWKSAWVFRYVLIVAIVLQTVALIVPRFAGTTWPQILGHLLIIPSVWSTWRFIRSPKAMEEGATREEEEIRADPTQRRFDLQYFESHYDTGQLEYLYSHYLAPDGQRWIKHGFYFHYHRKGYLLSEGAYEHDQKHGYWNVYRENGRRASQGKYRHGEKVGVWRFWNDQGQPEPQQTFAEE